MITTTTKNETDGLPRDDEVAARARAIFRSACEGADSYHTLRLGLARGKALNVGAKRAGLRVWAPLVGAAACCALVVGVVWMRPVPHATSGTSIASSAAGQSDQDEVVIPEVSSEQMEMVQNLDFYRWLAAQPSVASSPSGGGR
ncbi:MAG TPA: hypothetical protein VKV22_10065 [Rhodanobacteraceae bacterium]|nr:hypothetical protein [Rhodanobacteraceae bacterium]